MLIMPGAHITPQTLRAAPRIMRTSGRAQGSVSPEKFMRRRRGPAPEKAKRPGFPGLFSVVHPLGLEPRTH